jgi:beta-phosphoglucomutase-like phosphatase (HAD superfamily)
MSREVDHSTIREQGWREPTLLTLPLSRPKGSRKRTCVFEIEIPRTALSTMTLPRKAHAVVFDVDGLIFDTEPLYRGAMISAARESGHDMKLDVYHSMIGLSVEATRALLSEHFGRRFDFEVFWATASKQFYEMAGSQLYLKAGVVDLRDVLDDLCLPQAIATSSSREDVRYHLAQHRLLDRFQIIVAQGDYVRGKPNPDPISQGSRTAGRRTSALLGVRGFL